MRRLIWACVVCQCLGPGFTHSYNNRYLDFVQTCSLISLVGDNHGDNNNNLKEMLVYVYNESIVNNRPKNEYFC